MPTRPLRVVVAEDDDHLAELIQSILDQDVRFVFAGRAATGDQAVELVGEQHPDLVVMDIAMPSCDGIEATRLIHELDTGLHIVIYTASDEYGDIARAEEAGAAGFLHKDAVTSPELPDALFVLHTNHVRALPDVDSEARAEHRPGTAAALVEPDQRVDEREERSPDASGWKSDAGTNACPACEAPGVLTVGGGRVFCPACGRLSSNPGDRSRPAPNPEPDS